MFSKDSVSRQTVGIYSARKKQLIHRRSRQSISIRLFVHWIFPSNQQFRVIVVSLEATIGKSTERFKVYEWIDLLFVIGNLFTRQHYLGGVRVYAQSRCQDSRLTAKKVSYSNVLNDVASVNNVCVIRKFLLAMCCIPSTK